MYARLLVCCALLGAAACSGTDDESSLLTPAVDAGQDPSTANLDGSSPYFTCKDNRTPQLPQSDVELIDTLVPHHRMAIDMADVEIARGDNQEVKAMAAKMKADQATEVEELLSIRKGLTGSSEVSHFPEPHMARDIEMMMELSGAALDLMFVDDMIPHHASALQFTHYALPNLKDAKLIANANQVIDAQAMEVGHLHELKMKLREAAQQGGDAGTHTGDSGH